MPSKLDIHGDAKNAQVLQRRAGWYGVDAEVLEIESVSDAAAVVPDAITIGTGFDSDAEQVLRLLEKLGDTLHYWVRARTPLLAVGLGWELLSARTRLDTGTELTGIGVFSGVWHPGERSVAPALLDTQWGPVVGYEYHPRDYVLGSDEQPLGKVRSGAGNLGAKALQPRFEGAVRDRSWGTALRGPILARNPRLADAMLGEEITSHEADPELAVADAYAELTNRAVQAELE